MQPTRSHSASAGDSIRTTERRAQPGRPPAVRPRPRPASTPSHVRLLRTAGCVLAATWLPGLLGEVPGLEALGWWGSESGYLGLSWLIPAFLIGIAAERATRHADLPVHTAIGWLAGIASATILLLGAAQIIGG
jgi:hypothetical protein